MHTINEQLFLVNGRESRLTIGTNSIVWSAVVGPSTNQTSNSSSSCKSLTAKHGNSENISTAATDNELRFAQIIGTNYKKYFCSLIKGNNTNKKTKKKFKIYYAKDNELKSASQLLKIKSLNIESLKSSSSSSSSYLNSFIKEPSTVDNRVQIAASASVDATAATTTGNKSQQRESDEGQAASEPPSCYASEGSTSHLSSLSTCSSAHQAPAESQGGSESQGSELRFDEVCQLIEQRLERERQQNRPRRLLIFVNPYGGKGKAVRLYKSKVRRLLILANVESKLIVTKHANHARDTIEDPTFNVEYFDAIICIGGDGMFSELMNGLLFRYNRDKILAARPVSINRDEIPATNQQQLKIPEANYSDTQEDNQTSHRVAQRESIESSSQISNVNYKQKQKTISEVFDLESLRSALGGIGQALVSPPVPIGVIGAGSTDANSFGFIGTNDVITATLNIILGKQINIDVCSVHTIEEDRLLRFVSTFVAYGYFGDVVRESERLRWLGPSRYDVSGVNNLIKNRAYQGKVRILISGQDGSPKDADRCHTDCNSCKHLKSSPSNSELTIIERQGSFVGVNAAVTACRCPQTKKGFSPNNHLANGCVDLILVRPCSRMQYIQYLMRTGYTKKSAFDLKYVEVYRCRQFEFLTHRNHTSSSSSSSSSADNHNLAARPLELSSNISSSLSSAISSSSASNSNSLESKIRASNTSSPASTESGIGTSFSSWNVDGEILDEASIRVKVNNRLLRVFGTGEPNFGTTY